MTAGSRNTDSGAPSAISWPKLSTATRWHRLLMVSMSCSIITMPTPNWACKSFSMPMKRRLPFVSRPASTSSSSSSFGFVASALATSSALSSVSASSLAASRPALSSRLVKSRISSILRMSTLPVPKRCATIRFSRTLNSCIGCGIWKVRPRPRRARWYMGVAMMSRPSKRMAPLVGRTRPEIALKRVVLPAPLAPTRPITSWLPTFRVTRSTAVKPPKRTETLSSSSMFFSLGLGLLFTLEQLAQQRQQAVRAEHDHRHQQHPQHQLVAGGYQRLEDQLVDQIHHHRAEYRAEDGAVAAKDGCHDGQSHPQAAESVIGFQKVDVVGVEGAEQARHKG